MTADAPLTDDEKREAWVHWRRHVWDEKHGPNGADAFAAGADWLAARLDALHAEWKRDCRNLTNWAMTRESELDVARAERDAIRAEVERLRETVAIQSKEADTDRANIAAALAERDHWQGQAEGFLKAATKDLGRYHRLLDAITALADELTKMDGPDEGDGWYMPVAQTVARLRALLSEAGERRE